MCIRDSNKTHEVATGIGLPVRIIETDGNELVVVQRTDLDPVSYTHLRAHETVLDLVCRLLLEKKNYIRQTL